MTTTGDAAEAGLEERVRATAGVIEVYPASLLPGAPRVALAPSGDGVATRLRIGTDRSVPAATTLAALAETIRAEAGSDDVAIQVEIASIE